MALLDAAYLLSAIRSILNETSPDRWTDDQINKWVQEAAMDISTKTLGYEVKSTISVPANTLEVDQPPGCVKVHSCVLRPTPTGCAYSVLNTLEFDVDNYTQGYVVHLAGDYYAVAYRGKDNDGYIKTFRITASGTITGVDSYEFFETNVKHVYIRHITGSVYAVGYRQDATPGSVFTISISNRGVIGGSALDTWGTGVGTGAASQVRIVPIAGDVYAITYHQGGKNAIATVDIDASGNFSDIDSWTTWETVAYYMKDAILVAPNVVLGLISMDGQYRLSTLAVADNGTITKSNIDRVDYTATGHPHGPMQLIEITTGVFAIAYRNPTGNVGNIHTFGVDTNGNIDANPIDTHTFANCLGVPRWMMNILGNNYAVAYKGTGDDGFFRTINITDAGAISAHPTCSVFEFDEADCSEPQILPLRVDFMPVFYRGTDGDGFIKTIKIV